MEKILMIKGKSQYDSTMVFLEEMREELEREGMTVVVLDTYNETTFRDIRNTLQTANYDAIMTINAMTLDNTSLGHDILKDNVIYCTMLMDHPMIHHERLKNQYPYSVILSPDRQHVEYLKQYYSHIWMEGFLPHGGCQSKQYIPYHKRSIAISFMGSYHPPQEIWEGLEVYPSPMKELLQKSARYLLQCPNLTLEKAIETVLKEIGINVKKEEFASIVAEFYKVDHYIRSYYRDKVIRLIAQAGIMIDVYGDGWEKLQMEGFHSLRIHEKVDYEQSLELVADSKISLNIMPWFKEGSHDRVYSAMLCGAVCLTDASIYLQQECMDGENILFYDLKELEKLPEQIKKILNQEELGEQIAENGRKLAEEKHSWAIRGQKLIEYLLEAEKRRDMTLKESEYPI